MSQTIKGVWKFNETIAMKGWSANADATKEYVNFTAYRNEDEPTYNFIGFNLQHYTNSTGTRDNLQYCRTSTEANRVYVWQKRDGIDTYELGWQNEAQRTIDFGTTPQTVSDDFYKWFTYNAECISDNTRILSGVWKFNETIGRAPFRTSKISFRSNKNRYYFLMTIWKDSMVESGLQYHTPETEVDAYLYYDLVSGPQGWQNESYRIIDLGASGQSFFDHEYEWFTANATYLSESDSQPIYMDIDGVRNRVTAYMDVDGVRKKVSTAG